MIFHGLCAKSFSDSIKTVISLSFDNGNKSTFDNASEGNNFSFFQNMVIWVAEIQGTLKSNISYILNHIIM